MLNGREYILTADIGTTAVKAVLVDQNNRAAASESIEISTFSDKGFTEQDAMDWYSAFLKACREVLKKAGDGRVTAVSFSGQMQDTIILGADGLPLRRVILYSDARAEAEAEEICSLLGRDSIEYLSGNHFDGSIPFSKLLWIKKYEPGVFSAIRTVLFSAKDYIILKLTGKPVTDTVTAGTTGLMDIEKKTWADSFLKKTGIDPIILPELKYPHEEAGRVIAKASEESGLPSGIPVFTGTGDAGATTLASGISKPGEYNINLGTSGWVACLSDSVKRNGAVFNLSSVTPGKYINVTPFFNAGNVHKWVSGMLSKDSEQDKKYEYISELLNTSVPGSNGVLFLPYLLGERYPVSDPLIKGAFIGISQNTSKQDIARSCLEGVAFSLKEGFKDQLKSISLIGGGAGESVWCRIFADILDHEVFVFKNAEFMPSIAVAAIARFGRGEIENYDAFLSDLKSSDECELFYPDPEAVKIMQRSYERFKDLYPAIKRIPPE